MIVWLKAQRISISNPLRPQLTGFLKRLYRFRNRIEHRDYYKLEALRDHIEESFDEFRKEMFY